MRLDRLSSKWWSTSPDEPFVLAEAEVLLIVPMLEVMRYAFRREIVVSVRVEKQNLFQTASPLSKFRDELCVFQSPR